MIRRMRASDAAEAAQIAAASMPQPWSEASFVRETENDAALLLCAVQTPDGSLSGYISLQLTPDDAELTGIAVRPEARRRGIAAALLAEAEEKLREKGIGRIVLEVRASNAPAIAFYETHGFRRIGVRRGFYADPREDALVMVKGKEEKE